MIHLEPGTWADWFAGTMSFAAVATALFGYRIANRHRAADLRERHRLAAESVGWKLLQVLNQTADIARHLDQGLNSAKRSPKLFKFMSIRPLGVSDSTIAELTPEERSVLIAAKATDLAMDLALCIARYDSIRYSMREYKVRHEALFELMPPPVAMQGTQFSHDLSAAEMQKILPYARLLDALVIETIPLVQQNLTAAASLLSVYTSIMKTHFGKWHLQLLPPGEDEALTNFTFAAQPPA